MGAGVVIVRSSGSAATSDQSAFVDFPASSGLPLSLDAKSRNITGVIDVSGTAAGAVDSDVSLEALVNGQGVAVAPTREPRFWISTVSDNAWVHVSPRRRSRGRPAGARSPHPHSTARASTAASSDCQGRRGRHPRPSRPASTARCRLLARPIRRSHTSGNPARVLRHHLERRHPTPATGKHTIYADVHARLSNTSASATDDLPP